jgi:hypothetical protein
VSNQEEGKEAPDLSGKNHSNLHAQTSSARFGSSGNDL